MKGSRFAKDSEKVITILVSANIAPGLVGGYVSADAAG